MADGRSPHFTLDESRLAAVAGYVADVTREAYPDLKIPYHSRWRHFSAGGVDRWSELRRGSMPPRSNAPASPSTWQRSACCSTPEPAMPGVTATARPATPSRARRGLPSPASTCSARRLFSSDPAHPLRVDHAALARIDAATLARHFQVDGENPLVGLEQRSVLLRRLGAALSERPDMFGRTPARPGNLVDYLLGIADQRRIAASAVLAALLESLSSIWPSGLTLDGFAVGDAGYHPAARAEGRTDRIVPFHKLSQWLTYSLLEPLEAAGLGVEGLHELTALPEYRNGGLLVDLGVIRPRAPIDPLVRHEVSSELVVEWRALTVALMDPLVDLVRARLDLDASFTMPKMLQGGTWSAGRKIAQALRPPDGPSPIPVAADGTVF